MSEQLKVGVAASIRALAEGRGATLEAVASQADLMTLGCVVADATDHGRTTPSLDIVAGTAALLLEEAANSLEEQPHARIEPNRAGAARAALGLERGTQGKPLRGRRGQPGRVGLIARWLAYQPASLFNPDQEGHSPFDRLVDDMAEYVTRREVAHLVSERRLAQQARRPPLESALRVDWLPRFERYYAIWSYVAGLRYDVELAAAAHRNQDAPELEYFKCNSLWYYACFVRELEEFTRRRGGLWIVPDPKAEQTIADAVWMLREPTPMTELDDSVLRIAVARWDEMATFVDAASTDPALRALAERWRAWIESCACEPGQPNEDCALHRCTRWAASFMDAVDQQWDLLADWYDVPRPESVVDPGQIARAQKHAPERK
jgi:hypothetical protein